MKQMKRILALAMALALTLALLAGCGGNNAGGSSGSNGGNNSSSANGSGSNAGGNSSGGDSSASNINFPNGPIQVILPAKPGGDIDSSGRLIAKDLEKFVGVTLVPENIDGGGGNLALKQIMDGPADGQQMIQYFSYANAVVGGKLEYKWEDLVPVACYAKNDTQILVVSKDAPYSNAQELVAYMKEHPGEVTFAVTLGSPSHYHAVAFEQAAGVSFKKVDISSGSDKVVAMLSGECDVVSSTVGIMKDYLASGEAKVIGALVPERSSFGPDIPTLNEQGVDIGDVGFGAYYTVWVKAGTPQETIDYLAEQIGKMVEDPTFIEDCENLQFEPYFMAGQDILDYEAGYYDFINSMGDVVTNDTF